MKQLWEDITAAVDAALLNEEEKQHIKEKVDKVLGTYLIEDQIPIERGSLSENEWVVYKEVMEAVTRTDSFQLKVEVKAAEKALQAFAKKQSATKNASVDLGNQTVQLNLMSPGGDRGFYIRLNRNVSGWAGNVWMDDSPKTLNFRGKSIESVVDWLGDIRNPNEIWRKYPR